MNLALYVSLFLPYPFFIFVSLPVPKKMWEEKGRREIPCTVICNQGNGQSPSVCETFAPTHETLTNTSLAILDSCSNVAATWTLTAKESFRSQASPCTIRGRPNHTTMCLSPSTSVHTPPPPTQHVRYHSTNTPYSYLINLPGDGQRSHQRPLIHRDIPPSHDDNDLSYRMPFV
jgi:hypothetical protein